MAFEEETTNDLLRENIRLTRENNKLVKKLWRAEIFGFWSKVLFIVVMIGIPVFVYKYYLVDYLQDLQGTYMEIRDSLNILGVVPGQELVGNTIDSFQDKFRGIE